jgi:pimeloyl-ACP methyl ester carboxylesterase
MGDSSAVGATGHPGQPSAATGPWARSREPADPGGRAGRFLQCSAEGVGDRLTQRMYARTQDRDTATSWATREAQYDAVCTWGIPNHALLQRLGGLQMPVFVANGDSDPMILPHYSYLLAGLIPQASVKIYPDAAHGFLFQHHADFAADVEAFLR